MGALVVPAMPRGVRRRSVLRGAGALAAAAGAGALAGCTASRDEVAAAAAGDDVRPITLGYVTSRTGPLAAFGEADGPVIQALGPILESGFQTRAGKGRVNLVTEDCASDPALAAQVARKLVEQDRADMVLMASVAETMIPVSEVCEAAGVPCVTTAAPWESWFFGRGASPVSTFDWTYHFFIGIAEIQRTYFDMWDEITVGGRVGALWPNDADGRAWSDNSTGFGPPSARRGYEILDPGQYPPGTEDFTAIIDAFRTQGVDIIIGVPTPPEFIAFWQQAGAAGYRPRLTTISRAITFPSVVGALGPSADGLGTTATWTPSFPYRSSLTGQTAQELADEFTATSGAPWTQPVGFVHALFEVAAAAFASADGPGDRDGVAATLATLQVDTVAARLDWQAGPVPNVSSTAVVGCQWRVDESGPDLVIVTNSQALDVPVQDTLREVGAPQ